ncbi:uncharacterized protein LOC125492389 [Beta vulgaris subsp. vulgaris]|uniref:uncharacterized protein LOC125492389 n=1 Tax=Beta vulgaris subsp. vulgaris TaxID=3555 RepID=UPI00203672FE|nr:uncharacterized protein LOC125492389 [Beta vulgaris subsp. vulgaris]
MNQVTRVQDRNGHSVGRTGNFFVANDGYGLQDMCDYCAQHIKYSNSLSMHAIVQLRNPYLSPNILYFEETYQVSIRKLSVGGEPLPDFDTSLRSRAASLEGDDDEDEDKIEDNYGEDRDTQAEKMSTQFWSHAKEEVLENSWLQVSTNKYVGTNHKGNTFWGRVTDTFVQVRRYRNRCCEERVQGIKESDLLKEGEMDPLRSRWKRINASVSKFVGAYAHAEARSTCG